MKYAKTTRIIRIVRIALLSLFLTAETAHGQQQKALDYLEQGGRYFEQRSYDQAIKAYTAAIQIEPDYFDAYYNRGLAYRNKGGYDKAIADFDTALRLRPEFFPVNVERGLSYAGKGSYDRAVADYTEAVRLSPNFYKDYGFECGWSFKGDDKDKAFNARANFRKALQINTRLLDDITVCEQKDIIILGTYNDGFISIEFAPNGKIELGDNYWGIPKERNFKTGKYIITDEGGINFLNITWDKGGNEKLLALTSYNDEMLFLYNADSTPFFWGVGPHIGGYRMRWLVFGDSDEEIRGNWVTVSSALTEGRTVYSTGKMGPRIGECWVEGAEGHGIHEKLTLSLLTEIEPFIYISSGFVSYSKPYLYRENSRIKTLRIYNDSGLSKIVELKDTPHFQAIDVRDMMREREYNFKVYMEILEVYPGTKFADTCVNSICYRYP